MDSYYTAVTLEGINEPYYYAAIPRMLVFLLCWAIAMPMVVVATTFLSFALYRIRFNITTNEQVNHERYGTCAACALSVRSCGVCALRSYGVWVSAIRCVFVSSCVFFGVGEGEGSTKQSS